MIAFAAVIMAPVSALAGVTVAEIMNRKRSDRFFYTEQIMKRRLDIYESVYNQLRNMQRSANFVFEDLYTRNEISKKDLTGLLKDFISIQLKIAEYTDNNRLYVDRVVSDQVTFSGLTMAEVASLIELRGKRFKSKVKEVENQYLQEFHKSSNLVMEYSGISKINKEINKINKARTITDYSRSLEKLRDSLR